MDAHFPARFDFTTKLLTVVVIAVLAGICLATQNPIVAGLTIALVLLSFAYSPRGGYSIANAQQLLIIHRLIGNARIPLDTLAEARPAVPDDTQGAIRIWGNAGFFGYFGLFQTARLGRCTWYLTNRKNAIILRTAQSTCLVSPNDVDSFLAALPTTTYAAPPHTSSDSVNKLRRLPLFLGVFLGLLAILITAAALLYSPGRPPVTIDSDSLTIHDRFYPVSIPADTVDISKIRILSDIDSDPDWHPVAKTSGFGNSRYKSGWFRVSSGKTVRLYRSDGHKQLVLLPTTNAPVLLDVNNPEDFLAQLSRKWHTSAANPK